MSDPTTVQELESELDHRKSQNAKILHLLSMMERLWPDDEKAKVQSLMSQVEATKNVLQDCSEQLEKKR